MHLPDQFWWLAACVFLAGVVRGFSGFGLSAVLVASGSFFISPKLLIPSSQMLEAVASIFMISSVWRDINWKWLTPMAIAYGFSIPLGVASLAYLPVDVLRVAACVVLLIASMCLLLNARPKLPDGLPLRFGTGLLAGYLAGAASIGGMVGSVMLFAASIPAKNLRATLVVLFFGSALYSLAWGTWHGIVTTETWSRTAWLCIPMVAGITLGTRGFHRVNEGQFRKAVLAILALLSLAGIVSVVIR
jgi:uncharacterized protein